MMRKKLLVNTLTAFALLAASAVPAAENQKPTGAYGPGYGMQPGMMGHGMMGPGMGMGMMGYGNNSDRPWVLAEEAAEPIVRAAVEAGIYFFDTANAYSNGASEVATGRVVVIARSRSPRRRRRPT